MVENLISACKSISKGLIYKVLSKFESNTVFVPFTLNYLLNAQMNGLERPSCLL